MSVYRTEFGGKSYVLAANANQTGESSVVSPSISFTSSFLPLFLSLRRHTEALKDIAMVLKTRLKFKISSERVNLLVIFLAFAAIGLFNLPYYEPQRSGS